MESDTASYEDWEMDDSLTLADILGFRNNNNDEKKENKKKKTKTTTTTTTKKERENFRVPNKIFRAERFEDSDEELLFRKSASAMMCSCRNPRPEAASERGFDPEELLGFLRAVAASSTAVSSAARVSRLSARIYAYRRYVSLCRTGEVDEGFRPERLLGFVRGVAVLFADVGEESAEEEGDDEEVGRVVAQLDSYREFVSVRPGWSYRLENNVELDDEECQGIHQEISDSSSMSEEEYVVTSELEDDIQEEEEFQDQMQDGRISCVVNKEVFIDEECDYMFSKLEAGDHCDGSAGEDSCSSEHIEMNNLCTYYSSQEFEVDVHVEGKKGFQVDQTGANGTEFLVNEESTGLFLRHVSNNLLKKIDDLGMHELVVPTEIDKGSNRISESTLENNRLERENFTYVDQTVPILEDNSDVEPTPCLEESLLKSLTNKGVTHTGDDMMLDIKFESYVSAVHCMDSARSGSTNIISGPGSPKAAPHDCTDEKSMLSQFTCTTVEHDNADSSTVVIPSADNCFSPSPSLGGQLLVDPANDSEASGNAVFSSDVNFQHCADDRIDFSTDDINQVGTSNNGIVVKKRRREPYIASDNLNCIVTPSSRIMAYASPRMRDPSSTHNVTRSNDEDIVASDRNFKKFSSSNDATTYTYDEGANMHNNLTSTLLEQASKTAHERKCRSLPKYVSKSTSHKKEGRSCHTASDFSKWRRFYASPLTRDESKSPSLSHGRNEESTTMDKDSSSTLQVYASMSSDINKRSNLNSSLPKHAVQSSSHKKSSSHHPAADLSIGHRVCASPLKIDRIESSRSSRKVQMDDRFNNFPKSLHMKFPRDFSLPSKEELVKKFSVFGPLDRLRTKVSTFTGAGQVVFLNQADAYAAYEYVRRKSVFGRANVRYWLDEYENYRKGTHGLSTKKASSVKPKPCLKRSESDKKEKRKVSFLIGKQPSSVLARVI